MHYYKAYITICYTTSRVKAHIGALNYTKEDACEEIYTYLQTQLNKTGILHNTIQDLVLELKHQPSGTALSRRLHSSDILTIRALIMKETVNA